MGNPVIEPSPAPPALQTVDVPSGSAAVVQVSGDAVLDEPVVIVSMETDSIAPGNKTGSPSVETNSEVFGKTHHPVEGSTDKKSATTIQGRLLIRSLVDLKFKVRKAGIALGQISPGIQLMFSLHLYIHQKIRSLW